MPDAAQTSHPSPSQLVAFAQDKLAGAERAALVGHVKACPACRQALSALPAAAESVSGRDTMATMGAPRGNSGSGRGTRDTMSVPRPGATESFHPGSEVPADLANHPRYEVLALLGQGGMGAVYKARHKKMNRFVALKVINAKLLDNPKSIERFQREVKAAAKLDHPNIVRADDADEAGGTHFLVMEFIEGTDLARYVDKKGPLPVVYACQFIRQAALGLEHAHQQGMVHRDIKPHNLMLTLSNPGAHAPGAPVVKVMDFGLALVAREAPSEAGLTGENALMGTADYIAPEQATDAHKADIRADIYSLGCSLFHLLAGRPPLEGANFTQKLAAHLTGNLPLGELPDSVPAELRTVLARMVAKEPADRYQAPAEVAQALLPFVSKGQPRRVETLAATPTRHSQPLPAGATEKTAKLETMPATATERAAPQAKKTSRKKKEQAERQRKLVVAAAVGAVAIGTVALALVVVLMVYRPGRNAPAATKVANAELGPGTTVKTASPGPEPPASAPALAISDERIVGKWESVDAPTSVIQEFSKDGQSKITFSGIITTGTYTLNGDNIEWSSGGTSAKVKVRFISSTEMELSDEAGQRVKYKKVGSAEQSSLAERKKLAIQDVVGVWECQGVNFGNRFTWTLDANGCVNGSRSRITWRIEGEKMIITNPPWVDTCIFDADGKSFTATNQSGGVYTGKLVSRR